MLIEKYEKETGKFTCVSGCLNWWAFTGTGNTPEAARKDMYLKQAAILKSQPGIVAINTNCA